MDLFDTAFRHGSLFRTEFIISLSLQEVVTASETFHRAPRTYALLRDFVYKTSQRALAEICEVNLDKKSLHSTAFRRLILLLTSKVNPTMSTYNWLITGASSGLGAQISLAALRAGHNVVATARNIAKAKQEYPEIEQKGGQWLKLDFTSKETASIVAKTVQENDINVVVNNAGYALRGVLEDLRYPSPSLQPDISSSNNLHSEDQIRTQMETNVFAPLLITKACLPHFRTQETGTIVNISSTSGMTGNAGYSLYAASKFVFSQALPFPNPFMLT